MEKIVVSPDEITEVKEAVPEQSPKLEPKLAPAIPWWARLTMAPLVLVLPLLCMIALILRIAFRQQPPRTRYAWTTFMSTLLVISGFLTTAIGVVAFSFAPIPAIVSAGLEELDERVDFPTLPSKTTFTASDAAQKLKPLVAVISPAARTLFGNREMLSNSFGAGVLLQANSSGFLFATAEHVIGSESWQGPKKGPRALLSMASGTWAGAEVIARHHHLDLALVWMPRHSGAAQFLQPIGTAKEGETVFVIGHPQGFKFTLSTGIVSRLENSTLQISAPVSPGNSGGPVYDDQGNLIGIVDSTTDKSIQPNAENLNFAISARTLLSETGWDFVDGGREKLQEFLRASAGVVKDQPQSRYNAPLSKSIPANLVTHGQH